MSAPQRVPGRRPGLPARETRAEGAAGQSGPSALELGRRIVELAADKKAADIVLIAIAELTTVADYLVICSGGSERQLGAIADGIVDGLREEGVRPLGREGTSGAHWVLLDFGAVVVHVFAPPERDFYQLERLWADAPTVLRVQ
ncbi:MAG TPA: ribosome silencing factor [Candidatus Limnocylindrales bacterium]|nr:ribosome silencing factor [Candidatus Limnocylindrales bacterium]